MKLPQHLAGNQPTGIQVGEPVAQFEIGNSKNFVYLILDWAQKKAGLIDPQSDLSSIYEGLALHEFHLTTILLTHTHPDHTAGLPELVKKYPQVPIIVHREEIYRLNNEVMNHGKVKTIKDGDFVPLGNHRIQVIHTPGHSQGECCYLLEGAFPQTYFFSGDTVFIRDCGRTDLESSSTEQMFQSLQKIKRLPRSAILLPGHHYKPECASTLDREVNQSPPFLCTTVQELEALP